MKLFFSGSNKKIVWIRICLISLCFWSCGCLAGCRKRPVEYKSVDTAMGTILQTVLYVDAEAGGQGEQLTDAVRKQILALEERELSKRIPDSVIGRINRSAAEQKEESGAASLQQTVEVPEALYQELLMVQQVAKDSGGALDITIGEVAALWNLDNAAVDGKLFELPENQTLQEALEKSGYEKLVLKDGNISVPAGVSLDLGAVGKGIACDRLLDWLETVPEVSGAVISLGGSILTYGEKPDGKNWNVGIVDPLDTTAYAGRLSLQGQWCVATSGDYERFVEQEGVRYHHIIDPETGYPADAGLRSVTIFGQNGCLCDALSTACFVLGRERGLELAEQYGVYAVLVEADGSICCSKGADQFFEAE